MRPNPKDFLNKKSQQIAQRMQLLAQERQPDALQRTEGGEDQSIRGKVQKGILKI
tara:strand:- start:8927 stop:9091 length:165 start_codon:yes stop_codon:yes gene_type:complete